jgi:LacI family transcriptional regulator, galactose operon repressor
MQHSIRIGLVFSHTLAYCRGVLRGIKRYAETAPHWTFLPVSPEPQAIRTLRSLRPAAVIAHVFSEELAGSLRRLRVPVVNVCGVLPEASFPRIGVDDHRCGVLAAEHLLERGFRHFGFVGHRDHAYSLRREAGFRGRIASSGASVTSYYEPGRRPFDPMGRLWAQDRAIERWVRARPRPVGIFAPNDIWGVQLTEICLQADLRVPEDVAIVGVDDDDLLCEFARPSLSSVALPTERIGYEAARQVQRLLKGAQAGERPLLLPPLGVIARRSTDILAVDDADIVAALRMIRERGHQPIRVPDLLREIPTSRRSLERRFRKVVGRSILGEIRRVHVKRASELLAQTDLPLHAIADRSGFTDAKRFSTVFRQMVGLTPSAYRHKVRSGTTETSRNKKQG